MSMPNHRVATHYRPVEEYRVASRYRSVEEYRVASHYRGTIPTGSREHSVGSVYDALLFIVRDCSNYPVFLLYVIDMG